MNIQNHSKPRSGDIFIANQDPNEPPKPLGVTQYAMVRHAMYDNNVAGIMYQEAGMFVFLDFVPD